MGVAGSDPQGRKLCLGVQFRYDFVSFRHRQFVGADRSEGFLGVNIKRCNKFFGGQAIIEHVVTSCSKLTC